MNPHTTGQHIMRFDLSIVYKLSALIVITIILSILIINQIYVYNSVNILKNHAIKALEADAAFLQTPLSNDINRINDDIRLLAGVKPTNNLAHILENTPSSTTGLPDPNGRPDKVTEEKDRLATIFEEMLRTRKLYRQIRFIAKSDNGKEILRLDRIGDKIVRIADNELQYKGHRQYFKQAILFSRDEVYLSDINLNREFGKISQPHFLVLRAAIPVYTKGGKVFGIIVINLDFGPILNSLKSNLSSDKLLYITNNRGDYLLHPDISRLYATDLGHENRIQKEKPNLLNIISNDRQRSFTFTSDNSQTGKILTFHKSYFNPLKKRDYLGIAIEAPYTEILQRTRAVAFRGYTTSALVTLIAITISIFLLRLLIRPLNNIADAVVSYSKGNKEIILPTEQQDEIGVLAREFSAMVKQKNEEEWIKEKLVEFNQSLIGLTDLNEFATTLLKLLLPVLDAQIGAVYVNHLFSHGKKLTNEECLWLLSSRGYPDDIINKMPYQIRLKEGLVGICAYDRKMMLIDDVPDGYIRISSALGEASPRQLILLPILFEDNLIAVVELATIKKITDTHKILLDQLSRDIGIFLNSINIRLLADLNGKKLEAMLDNAIDGFITIDDKGNIESINPAGERVFGYIESELIGKNIKTLMPEPYHSDHDGYLQRYAETGVPAIIGTSGREVSGKRKNGTIFPLDLSVSSFSLVNRRYFSGIIRDITERKEAEARQQHYLEELQGSEEELKAQQEEMATINLAIEEKNRELASANILFERRNKFLLRMSHEIRTPLNSIIGLTDILQTEEVPEPIEKRLEVIARSSNSLMQIVNNLLDFSKLQAGKWQPVDRLFNIDLSLSDALSIVETAVQAKKLKLHSTIKGDLWVIGDPDRYGQILLNLLSNAVRYTDAGSIDVSVSVKDLDYHSVIVETSVRDTGIGMSQEEQKNIFDIFIQSYSDEASRRGGTGLGLAIVDELIKVLGGKLTVESTLAKGSVFTFALPMRRADMSFQSEDIKYEGNASYIPLGNVPLNILVVEDNEANRLVASDYFKKLGYEIEIAINGKHAIEMVSQKTYDIIFMDILMPVMDGIEATNFIRSKLDKQPLIYAMTANVLEEDRDMYIMNGMDGLVEKPISLQKIGRILQGLSHRQSIQQNTGLSVEKILKNFEGNKDLAKRVMEHFVSEIPTYFSRYENAINNRNAQSLREVCHAIKNEINYYDTDGIALLLNDLERIEDNQRCITECTGKLSAVHNALQEFDKQLRELIKLL